MVNSKRQVDLFSLRSLRFHVPLLLGVAVCIYAGWFELTRARHGHTIAWVYAFEWPGFAVVGTYIWWRTIVHADDVRESGRRSAAGQRPPVAEDDPGLVAWRQYLADAERADRAHDTNGAD